MRTPERDSSRRRFGFAGTVAILGVLAQAGLLSQPAVAQCRLLQFEAFVPSGGDSFGQALAADEDELVVGARNFVSIYVRTTNGTPFDPTDDDYVLQSILPTPGLAGDGYGRSVSMDGDHLVVGSPTFGLPSEGRVYVYRREDNALLGNPIDDSWTLEATLSAVPLQSAKLFGTAVALYGDRLAIGVPTGIVAGLPVHGQVHTFRHQDGGTPSDPSDDSWALESILVASDTGTSVDNNFGRALELRSDRLLVGARFAGPTGTVYDFRLEDAGTPDPGDDTWVEQAKIVPPPGYPAWVFGFALDLDGDNLLIGAWEAAFVYRFDDGGTPADPMDDAWIHTATIVSPDPDPFGDEFGTAVALRGDTLLVGAPEHGVSGEGAAYVFHLDQDTSTTPRWLPVIGWKPSPVLGGDRFGEALMLTEGHALVAKLGTFTFDAASSASISTGAVTVFAMAENPWLFMDAALPGSNGTPCLLGTGSLSPATEIGVVLDSVLGGAASALVAGVSALGLPFKGGVLVPSADLVIWLVNPAAGKLTLSDRWPPGVPSGTELYLQTWIVDAAGPAGWAATNGLRARAP